ncbi:hypothetical protein HN371_01045 [Candidatus Poribacteria bacterium]|nr:hypothetical protein [Candidatus Poribacteria bacterium]
MAPVGVVSAGALEGETMTWTKEDMERTQRRMMRNLCDQIEGDTGACPGCASRDADLATLREQATELANQLADARDHDCTAPTRCSLADNAGHDPRCLGCARNPRHEDRHDGWTG